MHFDKGLYRIRKKGLLFLPPMSTASLKITTTGCFVPHKDGFNAQFPLYSVVFSDHRVIK